MGRVICAECGRVGHTMGRCPELGRGERIQHVADRPRRCSECDGPVLLTIDGRVTNDQGTEHRCHLAAAA